MALRVGAPAEGDDFFDRVVERAQLWRVLPSNHVVLSAPRRLGKTSLLKKLVQEAADHGLLARYVDLQSVTDAGQLIEAMERQFPEETVKAHVKRAAVAVKAWFSGIERIKVELPVASGSFEIETRDGGEQVSWQREARRLQARLSPEPVFIVLDEFSVFLARLLEHDAAQAVELLAWLRAWRQQTAICCRILLSGSISLNALLERHGLQTETNDCFDFKLKAFAPDDAVDMLLHFSQREGWCLAVAEAQALSDRAGWLSPYYLMLLLEHSIQAAMARLRQGVPCGQPLTAIDVDQAFDQLIGQRSVFVHWYRRLDDVLTPGQDVEFARRVLARLSRTVKGITQSTLMEDTPVAQRGHQEVSQTTLAARARVLLLLEEHGYVVSEGQRVLFQSPLLRQYWKKNHAQ